MSNMKKIIIFIIIVVVALIVIPFNSVPKEYEDDIIDNVRYHIASANYMIDEINELSKLSNSEFGGLVTSFLELASLSGESYYEILNDKVANLEEVLEDIYLSNDTITLGESLVIISKGKDKHQAEIADKILEYYNRTTPILSDYDLVSNSGNQETWQFSEIVTSLEFLLTIISDEDNEGWQILPVQDVLEQYIINNTK